MNPAPTISAAAGRAAHAAASPRPTACPTITAAALDTPSGTMNVSDARFSATWCAATCSDAEPAHKQRDGAEHADLEHHLRADRRAELEHPRERRVGRADSARRRRGSGRTSRHPSASSSAAMNQRLIVVAHAEPSDAERREAEMAEDPEGS